MVHDEWPESLNYQLQNQGYDLCFMTQHLAQHQVACELNVHIFPSDISSSEVRTGLIGIN